MGPTASKPGPMLLKQENTAEMLLSRLSSSSETTTKLPKRMST